MSQLKLKSPEMESDLKTPPDFRQALAASPKASAEWNGLTPISRRDFLSWIESAKQAETRQRRIERACSMLVEGKRRPCCYSIVSMDLHIALKQNPAAKTQWSHLTADEKRDFTDWIDSAKERPANRLRIREACVMMAAGKRKPRA